MADKKDMDLMRDYADGNLESAFAELVQRHINLVYSVALRYAGNSQDAQDITQAVFVILLKKIPALRQRTALTGWLYETTRFTARQLLRTRARQQAREQEAYMQSLDSSTESVWKQLAPMLEDAMNRLSEKDRALIALRFFENKSIAETAVLLGIEEWAARKRIERAMEKLQKFFFKRGVTSTAETMTRAISANSVQAAPAMLANAATALALAKGATASTSTATLIKGALKIMAWTKTKTAIIAGVVVIFMTGTTVVTTRQIQNHVRYREIATALLEMHHEWATNDYHAKGMTVPKVLAEQGDVNVYSAGILGAYVQYHFQKGGIEWNRRLHILRANTNTTTWILFDNAEPKDPNLARMAWSHTLVTVTGDPRLRDRSRRCRLQCESALLATGLFYDSGWAIYFSWIHH